MSKNGQITADNPAEHVIRVLAQHGFAPNLSFNTFYIEFVKDYADDQGRRARAIVQFEKPSAAVPEVRLSGFGVVVQAHIDPTQTAILERAPPVMRDDLLSVAATFESGVQRAAVVIKRCEGDDCGKPVNEFFMVAGKILCRGCKEQG